VSTLKMEAVYYPKTLVRTYHELHAQLFLQPIISVVYEITFYFSKIFVQYGILWKGIVPFEYGYTKSHTHGSVASYSFILFTLLIMSSEHGLDIYMYHIHATCKFSSSVKTIFIMCGCHKDSGFSGRRCLK
jgi:hypothetical protein